MGPAFVGVCTLALLNTFNSTGALLHYLAASSPSPPPTHTCCLHTHTKYPQPLHTHAVSTYLYDAARSYVYAALELAALLSKSDRAAAIAQLSDLDENLRNGRLTLPESRVQQVRYNNESIKWTEWSTVCGFRGSIR